MKRDLALIVLVFLLLKASIIFANEVLDQTQMLDKLLNAGIQNRMIDKTYISPQQSKMLPAKPVSIFSMHLDLKHTRNIRVTAIEFDSEALAQKMDDNPINGFQARNWFFIGGVDVQSTREIVSAIVN